MDPRLLSILFGGALIVAAPVLGQDEPVEDSAAVPSNDELGDDDSALDEPEELLSDWSQTPAIEGVTLSSAESATKADWLVTFTVENSRGEAIYLFGCRPVQGQMFGDDGWVNLPSREKCKSEGTATKVELGNLEVKVAATGRRSMLFRGSLTYGVGCTDGLPLSTAGCRDFATVVTDKIQVTPAD
jgi:hypothetical protein